MVGMSRKGGGPTPPSGVCHLGLRWLRLWGSIPGLLDFRKNLPPRLVKISVRESQLLRAR